MGRTSKGSSLIKSKERVKKYGEVFTPPRIVGAMLDMVEEASNGEAFTDLTKTFLEPTCGDGNFLVEIFRRKLNVCKTEADGITALQSIYGIDIMRDNVEAARQRLYDMYVERFDVSEDTKTAVRKLLADHIIWADGWIMMVVLRDAPTWEDAVAYYRGHFPKSPAWSVFQALSWEAKRLKTSPQTLSNTVNAEQLAVMCWRYDEYFKKMKAQEAKDNGES